MSVRARVVIVMVTVSLGLIVPRLNTTVCSLTLYVPCDVVTLRICSISGSGSLTNTAFAGAVPWLRAVIVKIAVSPGRMSAISTNLTSTGSANTSADVPGTLVIDGGTIISVPVGVGVFVPILVPVLVPVTVFVAEGVLVRVLVTVPVPVGVKVKILVCVAVRVWIDVAELVGVAVRVPVLVFVGVAVRVWVEVPVGVDVFVLVPVGVSDGVFVSVAVWVAVAVSVGVGAAMTIV